jgi:hypothetical protein
VEKTEMGMKPGKKAERSGQYQQVGSDPGGVIKWRLVDFGYDKTQDQWQGFACDRHSTPHDFPKT